jgi:hypothetical protein
VLVLPINISIVNAVILRPEHVSHGRASLCPHRNKLTIQVAALF